MALGPGPAGLKFWTPQGLTADNTADINNLPAGAVNWFNPWGPKRPVQDWIQPSSPSLIPAAVVPADTTNLPAGANWFNPWGPRQPQRTWTQAGIQLTPVILTAAGGSYTLTGTAAFLAFGQVAGSGSYSVTGSSVALALGHVAGAGSYTLTGTAAGLTVAVNYAAAAGSYTITGSAATFAFGHGAGAGSYTLTGSAAGLVIPGGLPAAAGSYALTGSAAALTVTGNYLPAGMTGDYAPWGRPHPISLRSGTGRLPPTGPVTLPAAAGNYTLTGSDAALVVPGAAVNMPAGMTGSYVPWGRRFPINLRTATGRPLATGTIAFAAAAGSYEILATSGAIVFRFGHTANAGSYALTGSAAALTVTANFVLTAAAGSYTITGSSAALALRLTANSGSYTVSGSAAVLARGFAAGAGAYAILGTDAQLVQAGTITFSADAGSYTITGSAASLTVTVTPPEVTPPSPGGVGTGVRVGRYKQFKLKKKRKHDQCEELLEYLRSLPPAEAETAVAELPPRYLSLLDGLPLPHALVLPTARTDDDDDDACALLLELLLR